MQSYEELGRRAVAAKHWRWMPGVVMCMPPSYEETAPRRNRIPDGFCVAEELKDAYPDLSDPATAGCLLAIVFELEGRRVWPSTAAINLAVYGPTHQQKINSLVEALET